MDTLLSAHEIGEGFPVLIIHGWQMRGEVEEVDFEPIFNEIQGYRRIYVDLPGMGTTPANGIRDLDEMYLRLAHFINSQLGKSRFLLIGSSCGGYLAHALAQKYMNQVDGLLLRVPLVQPDRSKRDLDTFKPLVANEHFLSTLPAEDKEILGDIPIQTPAYVKVLKAKFDKIYLPAEKASNAKVLDPIRSDPFRYNLSFPFESEHTKFPAPTLIVCGRHDEVVGYRDSLRLLELYPRSTHVVLDRGTHALPVDEGGVFKALVRDLIARVEEWRGNIGAQKISTA